jgi:hypothetical protein
MTLLKELSKYKFDLVVVKKSGGRTVAQNQQENTHFSRERGMKIMN